MQYTNDLPTFSLPILAPQQKARLIHFAEQILTSQQKMMSSDGGSILQYMLQNQANHVQNKHYPPGERIDFKHGGQYFYHCHRENHISDEHGHFHCYLRKFAIPNYIKPNYIPVKPIKEEHKMTHLVAIALNRLSQPIRLFTLNHWVTCEVGYPTRFAKTLTRKYKLAIADESHWQLIDKWVEGVIQIFAPQIAWLHQERDRKIKQLQKNYSSRKELSEDKKIEEICSLPINLYSQLDWVIK